MMHAYPIIFLHTGNPPFLKTAINRAKLFNEESEIFLLGDHSNREIEGVKHFLIANYFTEAQIFDEEYYIHMSKNPYAFELICYQRWFVIKEFALMQGIEKFWYLDSDFLVFGNLSHYIESIVSDNNFDLIGFDVKNSGGGDSFMPCFNLYNIDIIEGITKFFKESYTNKNIFDTLRKKWRKHQVENLKGGICDMTQLKLFFEKYGDSFSIVNSYDLSFPEVADGNINSALNYTKDPVTFRMYLGRKYIEVLDYQAYAYLSSGRKIKLIGSHFQSTAKSSMRDYARKNYNPKNLNTLISYTSRKIKRHFFELGRRLLKSFL